jgi:hypothetical protein
VSGKLETPGSSSVLKNMVELPGDTFRMVSDRFYPEERPRGTTGRVGRDVDLPHRLPLRRPT